MTARVNLLPEETRRRARAARRQGVAVAMLVLLVGVLAFVHVLQRGTLDQGRVELAAAEASRDLAQQDVNSLSAFANLGARLDEARAIVAETLGAQVTVAGILQDVALILPHDADVDALSVTLTTDEDEDEDELGPVGNLGLSGETSADISPGVERLLLALEKVAGFRNIHVSSASLDDEGYTQYSIQLQLGPENRTERYTDGVPGGLR
jgi:Tfp pilus assembly protein PilN